MAHSTLKPIRYPFSSWSFEGLEPLRGCSRGIFEHGMGIKFSAPGNPKMLGPPLL